RKEMEGSQADSIKSRHKIARSRDRGRTPIRWQWNHVYLHRLPQQSEQRMEGESRQQYLCQLAGWHRWQGKRRRVGAGKANAGGDRLCGTDLRDTEQDAVCGGEKFRRPIRETDD